MRHLGHGEKMKSRAYRVTVTEPAKDTDATRNFDTTGIEICDDGSLYLPMVLGANIVREDDWDSVTIRKQKGKPAEESG